MATQVSNSWSAEALLTKAQRFFEVMLEHPRDGWQFAHWSSLAIELLARAALANISPALLADQKDWNNVYYALGHKPKAAKFVPHSIAISDVFKRLREILPNFTPDMEAFGIVHMNRRNEELHAGDTPFDGLNGSKWQPIYYETCTTLIKSMGKELELLVGEAEASFATTLISGSRDESAKAVMKSVVAHTALWQKKDGKEREKLKALSVVWATRQEGHRVKCPSCESDALVQGVPITAPVRTLVDDDIVERQEFMPSRFECVACGLKISSFAQVNACGLGDTFTRTSTYSAAEYYDMSDQYGGFDEDNNEP